MKYTSDITDTIHNSNTDKADTYSLAQLCRQLSISTATGRNWIRLGKIVPDHAEGKRVYFSKGYVRELMAAIQSGDNKLLKCRRNKKYVSGNMLYSSYVSDKSVNIKVVQELLDIIEEYGIEINDDVLLAIVAECALQLLLQRASLVEGMDNKEKTGSALKRYIKGDICLGIYNVLIDDLIKETKNVEKNVESYPRIFDLPYAYEEREDILGLLYISCTNINSRKATGSYYTPTKVVRQLVEQLKKADYDKKSIIDPCCGTGNFLLQLPDGFSLEMIYANDIDSISVKLARINMALKYRVEDIAILYNNIAVGNFLADEGEKKYDYIIGNPPWGYEFSEEECAYLRRNYRSVVGKSIESYDVFVEKALSRLKVGGVLSFVLPEAILNVRSHIPIRRLIAECSSIKYIAYLGNVFHMVQCPSIIIQLHMTGCAMQTVGMRVEAGGRRYTIGTDRDVDYRRFSFKTTDEEYNIIQKIKNVPGAVYLKGNADFALGIVTGNNDVHITHTRTSGSEVILKGSDIDRYSIRAADNYIVFKPESLQQVAPAEYYRAPEKLLYRFIGGRLVFAYDDRQRLTLNSCNILIPHIDGLDMKYILAVLNSSVVQFFYEKEFDSVKILRSHIEQIPIPRADSGKQADIIRLVDRLIKGETDEKKRERLYKEIDERIAKLYMPSTYVQTHVDDDLLTLESRIK